MLLGSFPVTIDEKFRLKIPAKFRRELPEAVYVTSDNGECAQIYPIPVWERFAQKFLEPPRMDPAKQKYQEITSYYGLVTEMDPQGRILIPHPLREDAGLAGEVMVFGRQDHLVVWNNEKIRKRLKESPLTNEDRERLAQLGF
jgi:MraZ protein